MQYIERKITLGWPQQAIEFIQLFARVEGALKQSGHLKRDKKKRAEADWTGFADSLGPEFFQYVRDSEQANTLVGEPPRRRMTRGLINEGAVYCSTSRATA